MAYNYNPYYYYPQFQGRLGQSEGFMQPGQGNGYQIQNVSQNGIIWVQGEAGAKAYPVAPGNTVQLWDSENQIIYLKSADVSGMPTMKILDYSIRDQQAGQNVLQKSDLSGYVTREEFEKVIAELKGDAHESVI